MLHPSLPDRPGLTSCVSVSGSVFGVSAWRWTAAVLVEVNEIEVVQVYEADVAGGHVLAHSPTWFWGMSALWTQT